jgi:hypothetical protein
VYKTPIPVTALIIENTGDNKLKKANGKYTRVGTPKVLATKLPAIPHGIK